MVIRGMKDRDSREYRLADLDFDASIQHSGQRSGTSEKGYFEREARDSSNLER